MSLSIMASGEIPHVSEETKCAVEAEVTFSSAVRLCCGFGEPAFRNKSGSFLLLSVSSFRGFSSPK